LSEEFERRIIKCMDKTLSIFGESFKEVILFYLEKNFDLKQEDVVERPQEFVNLLRNLFGSGAAVVERILVEEVEREFNIKLDEWDFAKAVEEARRRFTAV
jgi:hypothetical protein